MRIDKLIEQLSSEGKPLFSFEFFPPKTEEGEQKLYDTISKLQDLQPAYVSVTYGAGGSTRERTIEIVKRVKRETGIEPMAHFTCVGATVEELREVLDQMAEAGIENILALRGDPPQGEVTFTRTEGGFGYADELTALVANDYDFCVGGACYPEGHPESPDLESDIAHLKLKVQAGATFLVTQMFFDNDFYFDFVERARTAGITVPIVPGIMPIGSLEQIKRFTQMCGASIPARLLEQLEARADDPEAVQELGVAYATLQCADLLARGAPGIHFFTLNQSPATRAILSSLYAAQPWVRSAENAKI